VAISVRLSQPTALLIVVGGTLGAVMLQSPYATFVRGIRMVKWIWYPPVVNHLQLIQQVSGWSQVSRREGLLALDAIVNELKDEFTRKGLQLLVDGAEPDRLREVMEVEISTFEQEMKLSARNLGGGRRLLADHRDSWCGDGFDSGDGEFVRSIQTRGRDCRGVRCHDLWRWPGQSGFPADGQQTESAYQPPHRAERNDCRRAGGYRQWR
jgi:hypothetical protein